MKTFISLVGVIVVVTLLVFWGKSAKTIEPAFEVGVLHPLDHVKGNASSSVIIIEYSDFQCPACRSYYPIVREITTEYADKIAFVYRHFPLINIHPNAEFAARAAEAAHKQGKFWEMHDLLFEKQNEWARVANISPVFESYATLLGLSIEQFKVDFVSDEVKDLVRAERVHAVKAGLNSTPTFFINGEKIQNPNSVIEFKKIIDEALLK